MFGVRKQNRNEVMHILYIYIRTDNYNTTINTYEPSEVSARHNGHRSGLATGPARRIFA